MTQEQWNAIATHNKSYDGRFYYGSKTTKTVCRPSCTARTCKPKNVIIFDTMEDAIQRGFHSCSRCRPDTPEWMGAKHELAMEAKKLMEAHYIEKFSLDYFAGELFVNKSYLLRVFKEITGSTMLSYHNQIRCEKAKELLTHAEFSVGYICSEVGYSSPSHFVQVFKRQVGCTPKEYQTQYFQSLAQAVPEKP